MHNKYLNLILNIYIIIFIQYISELLLFIYYLFIIKTLFNLFKF